jgi:hypothetical protein
MKKVTRKNLWAIFWRLLGLILFNARKEPTGPCTVLEAAEGATAASATATATTVQQASSGSRPTQTTAHESRLQRIQWRGVAYSYYGKP